MGRVLNGSPNASKLVDVEKLKREINGCSLDILAKRGLKVVGSINRSEIQIINEHRGEKTPSAAWNPAKGLLCDKGDSSYDGDLVHVVMKIDGCDARRAMETIAKEGGTDLPFKDGSTARPHKFSRQGTEPRAQQPNTSRWVPEWARNGEHQPPKRHIGLAEETLEQKIAKAQKLFASAGPVMDSHGEAYLNDRAITLPQEEPWVRFTDGLEWKVRVDGLDGSVSYPPIGNFPALVCGATVAGVGPVVAVAKIYFGVAESGAIIRKPQAIDPRTGAPPKKYKSMRGSMSATRAAIWLGMNHPADTVVVLEGIEDGLGAVMCGYRAAAKMNATGLENLDLPSETKVIVLAGDNDGAGRKGVLKAATAYHNRGLEVRIVEIPSVEYTDKTTGETRTTKDLNDVLEHVGKDSLIQILLDAKVWTPSVDEGPADDDIDATEPDFEDDSEPDASESKLIEMADEVTLTTDADYLVKGLLSPNSLAVIYGPPAAGKSFLALHLGATIVRGQQFAGRRTRPAPVLYVGLEGEGGLKRRFKALTETSGPAPNLGRIVVSPVLNKSDLGKQGQATIMQAIANLNVRTGSTTRLIIVDTLARAMSGDDENSAQDMGAFINRLKCIADQTGVAVLVVHHSGKDIERGMRGSSALLGAADLVVQVRSTGQGEKRLVVEKNKDGPDAVEQTFALKVHSLGIDSENDPVTSCYVEFENADVDLRQKTRIRPRATSPEGKALIEIEHLGVAGKGEKVPHHDRIPDNAHCYRLEDIRDACRRKGLTASEAKDEETRRRAENAALRRALEKLEAMGWLASFESLYWIPVVKGEAYTSATPRPPEARQTDPEEDQKSPPFEPSEVPF